MTLKEYIHKHDIKDKRVVYELAGLLPDRRDFEEWRMDKIMLSGLQEKMNYHRNLVDTYQRICDSIRAGK